MSSEDSGLSHLLEGGCKTLAALEQFAHPLEDYEGGMTFVQVPSLGLETERAQSTDSPDAQNNFLPKSYLAIAAIESRRQLSFRGCVFLQIRIQQVKLYTTYLHAPDGDHHHTAANRHSDETRLPFGAQLASERSVMPIELLVYLLLPAIPRQVLMEVTLRVHKSDTDERYAQVTRFLAVITCQHTQPTRIDGERLVQGELSGEIGNQRLSHLGELL